MSLVSFSRSVVPIPSKDRSRVVFGERWPKGLSTVATYGPGDLASDGDSHNLSAVSRGGRDRAFARYYPTIAIDGCEKLWPHGTEVYSSNRLPASGERTCPNRLPALMKPAWSSERSCGGGLPGMSTAARTVGTWAAGDRR